MILHCNFEELSAATASVNRVLGAHETGGVAAPPEVIADIEALSGRLTGDLTIESLFELRGVRRAIDYLLSDARQRTDSLILEEHAAAESAVVSYFEYAHLLALADRAERMGEQMAALIELMSGQPVTEETARSYSFAE